MKPRSLTSCGRKQQQQQQLDYYHLVRLDTGGGKRQEQEQQVYYCHPSDYESDFLDKSSSKRGNSWLNEIEMNMHCNSASEQATDRLWSMK
jgi:hypothetical protein